MAQVTLSVEEITGKYVLRKYVGRGCCEGCDFEWAVDMPLYTPIVTVNDRTFTIPVSEIIRVIVQQIVLGTQEDSRELLERTGR